MHMASGKKVNILIVEDNEDDIFFIKKVLPSEKYSVKIISNGAEAFNYLSAENKPESIVLLDNRLPEMNGLEILEKLQDKRHNYAFIFLTVDNQIETVVKAMKSGALDFIVKSTNLENVLPEKIEKVYGIYKNKEELKKTEEAFRESEKRFRNIVESSPMGMFLYELQADNRLIIISANKAIDEILGLDNSQFIGKTIEEAFPPLIKTEIPAMYRIVAAEGTPWRTEETNYKDNKIHSAFEVFAYQISPGRMVAAFLNIKERKQSEEKMRNSEEQFRTLVEQSPSAIEIYEPDGKLILVNNAWTELWNLKKEDVADFNIFNDPQSEISGLTTAFRAAQKGMLQRMDDVVYTPDSSGFIGGRKRWISPKMYPLTNQVGKVENIVLTYEDITERKQAENELKEYREKLETLIIARTKELEEQDEKNG